MAASPWRMSKRPAPPQKLTGPEIEAIEGGVQKMFQLVADRLARATNAFLVQDRASAATLVASDHEVDSLQLDVEDLAQRFIVARSTLTDGDVRLLVSVLRIVPELERSADLVEHIALRTGVLTAVLPDEARLLIADMGTHAVAMWRAAGEAWIRRDAAAAESLREADDVIDDLHVRLTASLSGVALTTPEAIELGLVARFFERLGDHAVNVTRRLTFLEPDTSC
jgi:phosphate transport system protein